MEDRRAPLGARRAAVLAVLGCTLLVTLLVTWAASIGPGSVLEGKGADLLTFTGGPTPTESSATTRWRTSSRTRRHRRGTRRRS